MQQTNSVFDFIDAIIAKCSSQLPRDCSSCGKTFHTFREFVSETTPIAAPQSLIKEGADPIGIISYVNCKCGNTMALQCEDVTGDMQEVFRQTVAKQSKQENKTQAEILVELRTRVRERVISQAN